MEWSFFLKSQVSNICKNKDQFLKKHQYFCVKSVFHLCKICGKRHYVGQFFTDFSQMKHRFYTEIFSIKTGGTLYKKSLTHFGDEKTEAAESENYQTFVP